MGYVWPAGRIRYAHLNDSHYLTLQSSTLIIPSSNPQRRMVELWPSCLNS
jgi:hypothetical protein